MRLGVRLWQPAWPITGVQLRVWHPIPDPSPSMSPPSLGQVERPPRFPPTFLYTQSWEDPAADAPHLGITASDVCLTLTSGGCNSLELCLAGAAAVYSVDCNPAQSALLELKATACAHLPHDDVWALFGEGRHPNVRALYERHLAPHLSQGALRFWGTRLRYFDDGLYFHGGMVRSKEGTAMCVLRACVPSAAHRHLLRRIPPPPIPSGFIHHHHHDTRHALPPAMQGRVVWVLQLMVTWLGMRPKLEQLAHAPDLAAQISTWDRLWDFSALAWLPAWMARFAAWVVTAILFNPVTLW